MSQLPLRTTTKPSTFRQTPDFQSPNSVISNAITLIFMRAGLLVLQTSGLCNPDVGFCAPKYRERPKIIYREHI
ncbi:hypothetical protein FBU59_005075 [Linderina macrospora]|uniref:Uncharacterized protein n=1 Tax=Linderina macrospora TaxID=4868 RepID=A0ACC1J3K8_9FUNG|nr:hypothetical protein FBU59_005075 [Linderina macrospora]